MEPVDYGFFPFELPEGQTAIEINNFVILGCVFLAFVLMPFTYCLGYNLRKKQKTFNIVTASIGIFLILFEIYKQITYAKIFGYLGKAQYLWRIIPLQICSLHMYILPICPFIKNEKVKNSLLCFSGIYSFIGGVAVIGTSAGLHSVLFGWQMANGTTFGDWGMVAHTIIWHAILINLGTFICGYFRLGDVRSYSKIFKLTGYSYIPLLIFGIIAEFVNIFVPLIYGLDNPQVQGLNLWNVTPYYGANLPFISFIADLGPTIGGYHVLGGILLFFVYLILLYLANLVVLSILYFIFKFRNRVQKVVVSTSDIDI